MAKPKVAFYWCASCGGCEEAVVDLAEGILDVVAAVDIVFWPVALDFKYKDIEAMPDKSITVSFINGAIRTSEQEHVAKLLRKKSVLVIAFGACAGSGGIPALANLTSRKAIFDCSYRTSPSVHNPEGAFPKTESKVDGHTLTLPSMYETVLRLSEVIDVDYTLPGCPPMPDTIGQALGAILKGELPAKGSVLSPEKSLCSTCKRNDSKPDDLAMTVIKRPIEVMLDPEKCFLAQNVICMGPATRGGCGEKCIEGNMPCTGCYGAPGTGADQGAKMIGALGGLLSAEKEEALDDSLAQVVDPAGTFYRYTLGSSLLGSRRKP